MFALAASFMGLSSTMRIVIYAGLAAMALGIAITWLRWDATMDERTRAAAAGNAAVIEVIKDRNEIEEEINATTDDDLRDLLGIPDELHQSQSGPR